MEKQKKIRKSRVLFQLFSAISVMAWIIYQAIIYSQYAPDFSVQWECVFYILLYGSTGLALLNIDSELILTKIMFTYSASYYLVITGRYVYFLYKFIGDYDSYYHSMNIGWSQFKLLAPLFIGALIFVYKQWQMNR